jgi:arginase family enzyme
MEYKDYLTPFQGAYIEKEEGTIIHRVVTQPERLESSEKKRAVIVGIPFLDVNLNDSQAPALIRKAFYELADPFPDGFEIMDLGDLKKGQTFYDTVIGLRDIVSYLRNKNAFVLVLGGSGLFKSALVQSLASRHSQMNFVSIEPDISFYSEWSMIPEEITPALACKIIGTQGYYVTKKQKAWVEEHNFSEIRLGTVRQNMVETEPCLRDAQLTTISVNSMKHAEAPAQIKAFPNGFYGEEIARLARFVGMADSTEVCGIFDLYPQNDINNQTSILAGQVCWFLLEGLVNRMQEDPVNGEYMKKFIVNQNKASHELIFYKSEKTERWWMEIPVNTTGKSKIVACSYEDYRKASEQEVPERWLKAYQRFNISS